MLFDNVPDVCIVPEKIIEAASRIQSLAQPVDCLYRAHSLLLCTSESALSPPPDKNTNTRPQNILHHKDFMQQQRDGHDLR